MSIICSATMSIKTKAAISKDVKTLRGGVRVTLIKKMHPKFD